MSQKLLKPWLSENVVKTFAKDQTADGRIHFNVKNTLHLPKDCPDWRRERLIKAAAVVSTYDSAHGPVWVISPHLKSATKSALKGDVWLESSTFAKLRDAAGASFLAARKAGVQRLEVHLPSKAEDISACLVGIEIAQYRFRQPKEDKAISLRLLKEGKSVESRIIEAAQHIGWSTNVARHLTNMPPNALTPDAFATHVKDFFNGVKGVTVEVWHADRLKKENMRLLLAVGAASENPPCLVHIRYRPSKKSKPVALVGKGITFDSGGLDIKPASGMRLMKKDMGGAAAVLGATLWAAHARAPQALDTYLSLAENAIGSHSFRPGDVYISRSGQSVEISNTDAEGRLVLADAIDVAVTAKDEPTAVINVATLTGAIKVGLGAGLAGLFSNHTPLAENLRAKFWRAGDPVWIMPLYQKYRPSMSSTFADMVNSVEVPFGGAITAALFLENFVKGKPWAHLDIYAWKDSTDGAWGEAGGSGQAVMGLIEWLGQTRS